MATGRATDTVLTVQRFLQQVQQKQAGKYEPGSVGGATEHISGKVDGTTFDKQEGERSEENNKDVKKQVGPAAIVGEGEGKKKEAIDSIPTPGLREAPTGEDPENETSKAKRQKDDNAGTRLGRTTHIARADNPGLDKAAFDEMSLDQHVKVAAELGNQLLAAISVTPAEPASKQASAPADKVDEAAQLGSELAGLADLKFDKQAIDAHVLRSAESLVKTALDDAENVIEYLASFYEAKQAAQQPVQAAPASRVKAAAPAKRAMAMPPGGGAAPPPGGDGGGEAPVGEGPPPGSDGGGDEGGAAEGEEAQVMEMLEQEAAAKGISVQELIVALLEGGGGDAGAPAPGADPGMEVAGSQKTASAASKTAKRTDTTKMAETTRNYIKELLSRSRA